MIPGATPNLSASSSAQSGATGGSFGTGYNSDFTVGGFKPSWSLIALAGIALLAIVLMKRK